MTLALQQQVQAYPLGRPTKKLRYGMTPSMAIVYADLVKRFGDRPRTPFTISMRDTGYRCLNPSTHAQDVVRNLVDRGWIEPTTRNGSWTKYRFVHPVMRFPKVPNIWSDW